MRADDATEAETRVRSGVGLFDTVAVEFTTVALGAADIAAIVDNGIVAVELAVSSFGVATLVCCKYASGGCSVRPGVRNGSPERPTIVADTVVDTAGGAERVFCK